MRLWLRGEWREMKRRGIVALCAAYVLFALSPHFEMVSHRHAHGGRPHHHNFLSAHDVALEREVFKARIPGLSGAEPNAEVEGSARADQGSQAARTPLHTIQGPGLTEDQGPLHSHGQEDLNLAALGSQDAPVRLAVFPLPQRESLAPACRDLPAPRGGARAPPVSSTTAAAV